MWMWEQFSLWQWAALALAGVVAGTVDAIAGGGGLLTVPVLLATGLSPAAALGTNKLQATFGSATAAWNYRSAGWLRVGESLGGVAWTAAGSVGGALCAGRLSDAVLRRTIPVLLLGALVLVVLRPGFGRGSGERRISRGVFHAGLGVILGAYDGFFGPGVGAFWTVAYVGLQGLDLSRATAHTKLMNFTSNAAALAVFACAGQVGLLPGVVMGCGQLVGARLGARLVIYRGARLIRPVFTVVVAAVVVKLLWSAG